MKKANHSFKKIKQNTSIYHEKESQKKISVYFGRTSKDQAFKNKDNTTNDIVETTETLNEGICSKRKLMEDLESLEVPSKVMKCDVIFSDAKINQKQQQEMNEIKERNMLASNSNNINANKDACKSKPLPAEKNIVIGKYEYKENIDLDKSKNLLHEWNEKEAESLTMRLINNSMVLNDNNFNKNCSIKGSETSSIESMRNHISMYDNTEQLDKFHEHDESDFSLETCIIDDFNACFEEEWSTDSRINFNSLQRCKVVDVKREYNSLLLTVEHEDFASNTTVTCSGFWKDAKVEKNDIVAIQARKETRCWVVDNTSGLLVVHPDILISGTTITSALFCSRKAILAEKFRKIETLPYYKGDQTAMVIGSLTHKLLQKAIRRNICELSDVTKLMDSMLRSKETAYVLYASEITFDECRQQMLTFVPKIFQFIQHYLKDKKQQEITDLKNNFKGKITYIHDIEENIWLPKLGVKGKVDVTLEVNVNSKRKIMPLEIKTGKPSFSLEHRGQIILYIMMMTLTNQNTDTGLLLYLRENNMQEIKSGHPERRDLILLRNTLAGYFAPKLVEKLTDLTPESDWKMLELPEPINHPTACSKCPYNTLCCIYLSKDPKIQLPESHPLMNLSKHILAKFKPTHFDYITKWISLLQMEENTNFSDNPIKYLWTLSPEKREIKKICICNLKIIGKVNECDSKYQHTFVRANVSQQNVNIPHVSFTENEYVLVSTDSRMNISAGFIVRVQEDSITLLLDRDITKYNINELFHIDKYSSSTLFSFNLANIGGLMGDDEICAKLRDIVIDRKPATFDKGLSHVIVRKSAKIINGLNENQQRAVLKAMTANDYILIKGMPGTGKTQTLVALIELLHETKHSVLITAHTNSAVDNILLKLLDKGIDFLRLGSSSVQSLLKHKTEGYITMNCHTPKNLETVYSSKDIVGVTCYGAHHTLLGKRKFDVCVVDESAQAFQPTVLRSLYSAHKFVLVGDPDQLPPIVRNKVARKLGGDESLFARLDSENNTINLTKQYRMNKNIMHLANKFTYNDTLEVGNTIIENATFNAVHSENLIKQERWLQKVLSQNINDSVIILNTGCTNNLKIHLEHNDKYPKTDQIFSNIWEAAIILKLLQVLKEMDVKPRDIGIIAPYRAQISLLKKIIHEDIEVNTVDQYQGRDKEIIVYSCARSLINSSEIKEDLEVLGDHRRLTVAITRAKHKLIIIADKYTLSHYSPFRKLFSLIEKENIINLCDSCNDFSWKSVVPLL